MNVNDDELQSRLDAGDPLGKDGLDARAYREVFRALKKDPGYTLPPYFAERLADRVVTKSEEGLSTDYFWLGAGIFFLAMTFLATILFTGFTINLGFLNGMSQYTGLVVFALAFIVFLNWLDKRLVKDRRVQHD